jgi:hypothetical protein
VIRLAPQSFAVLGCACSAALAHAPLRVTASACALRPAGAEAHLSAPVLEAATAGRQRSASAGRHQRMLRKGRRRTQAQPQLEAAPRMRGALLAVHPHGESCSGCWHRCGAVACTLLCCRPCCYDSLSYSAVMDEAAACSERSSSGSGSGSGPRRRCLEPNHLRVATHPRRSGLVVFRTVHSC